MRVQRLIAILLLIESRGQMKAKDLARALETSERTIYRDVDALCESGVPLVSATGPNGGIALMDNYRLDLNRLYRDDVVNLYLSGIGFHPDGSEASAKLRNTFLKLEKSLPAEYRLDIENARNRFYYDETPQVGQAP
jgi:predicted DNA-binding transcriptional regulator YafY